MIDGVVAKRYAEALYEVAKERNTLDEVEADLQLASDVIHQTEDMLIFLMHPQIDLAVKKDLIDKNFKDSLSPISKNFLFQLIDSHRIAFIDEILKQFIKYANASRGVVDVEAITASPLADSNKDKVVESLKAKLGKKVRLTNIVDASIIGGMVIKIGDRVYDGSIDKHLKVLKRSLKASRV